METVLYTLHFNWLDCIWWLPALILSAVFIAASIGIQVITYIAELAEWPPYPRFGGVRFALNRKKGPGYIVLHVPGALCSVFLWPFG